MPLDANQPPLKSIGDYDIIAKIAEGGMGTVYKGRRQSDGLLVAIKIVSPATAKNQTLLKRFEREFRSAHELDHVNIVKAIECQISVPTPYLVMEFVDGESLGQKIEREGRMTEELAVDLITQVCNGLYVAHKRGLVHRDIKPDNVMITRDGVAKLTDLGLVKDLTGEDMNLTRTGRGLGTPHFMAPEQFREAKKADIRCDIYSLGATLYMMVTGEMPFGGCGPLECWMKKANNEFTQPKKLVPQISERINWAILRAMSALPENRPENCKEFVEDLTGRPIQPPEGTAAGHDLDLWYLVYKDEEGQTHTVKGQTEVIRQALTAGLLGDAENIVACRNKQGPFNPLRGHPEFRDLVIAAAPLSSGPGGGTTPGSGTRAPVTTASGRLMTHPSGRVTAPTGRSGPTSQARTPAAAVASASTRAPRPEPAPVPAPPANIQIENVEGDQSEQLLWLGAAAVFVLIFVLMFFQFSEAAK